MPFTLRPIDPFQESERLAELLALTSSYPITAEEMERRERQQPAGQLRQRLGAVDEAGYLVGLSDVGREPWTSEGEFWVEVVVDPAWHGQGLGARLYDEALAFARVQGATCLTAQVQEASSAGYSFAEQRGFRVERHLLASVLNPTTFDERPFTPLLTRAEAVGFRFTSLAELGDTPTHRRAHYDLNQRVAGDLPGSRRESVPLAQWEKWIFESPTHPLDGQLLVLDGDRWVGLAAVAYYPHQRAAINAGTILERDYRGRGLAQALKLLAIRRAQAYGALTLLTHNDAENAPVLAINRKFGYVPQPGFFRMRLALLATPAP